MVPVRSSSTYRAITALSRAPFADNPVLETYITHIRIVEYSSHPSTPPPPQARTPDSEKARVIIVAVRKSGRVRLHKSKENANGTYSIGKTWNLDDLTHIESYTGPQVVPSHREWAADTGFVVTLGKPYFWQSQTDKEKKFFIASLIKIYGKYTGGKTPELVGFDQKELDQVLGAGRRPAASPAPSSTSTIAPPPRPPMPANEASHLSTVSAVSTSAVPEPPRIQKTPPVRTPMNGASSSPAGSFDSTTSRNRPLQRMAGNNKSQDSVATSFARSEDASSLPPRSRNGMAGPGAFGRFGEPRDSPEPPTEPLPPTPKQHQEKPPPERRRPPMDPSRPLDRDLVPPPLMSPVAKKEPVVPPPRNVERMSPRKSSLGQQSAPTSLAASLKDRETPPPTMPALQRTNPDPLKPDPAVGLKSPSSTSLANSIVSSQGPTETPTPPPIPTDAEEEARPGLGPMIRSKKSKGDIAGAIWKAASAASAFKPRPGGAGDRLRQQQLKATITGPDGITDVVPAPPRPVSRDNNPPPPEPVKSPKRNSRNSNVPEVKVTVPVSSRPSSVQGPIEEKKVEEVAKTEEAPKPPPRRSVMTRNDAKYLQSLGIGPSLLDNRSEEFGKWLDHFGWVPGEQMRTRNIDDMKTDLERELNKAQAGGWLARFQEEDERVDAIKRGIDLSMSECEELDNLLTLYSVELSVRQPSLARSQTNSHRPSPTTLRTSRLRARVSRFRQPTRSSSRPS